MESSSSEEQEEVLNRKAKKFVKRSHSQPLHYLDSPLTERSNHKSWGQSGIPGIYLTESSDTEEETFKVKKKRTKKFVKQRPNLTSSSSSEDESKVIISQRKASLAAPNLTYTDLTDSDLTDGSGDEEEMSHYGTMKGGARQTYQDPITYAEQLELAILKAQERLFLDEPTPGLGNCCSCAFVQQCQRPPVRQFLLQSRGLTIDHFMQLKKNVAEFIQANSDHPKVQK